MKNTHLNMAHPTAKPDTSAEQEQIEAAWDAFVAFLKTREARITRARRIVMEYALKRDDHFRADDIADLLKTGHDRVSRGTVYRTLALMVDASLLRQIRDSDTHTHYEAIWNQPHHEHMICDTCGKFLEFTDEGIATLLEAACKRMGFKERTHRVAVFGTCRACQETKKNKR